MMLCAWDGICRLEFVDEQKYWDHCTGHIWANIAAARAKRRIHLPEKAWLEVLARCDQRSLEENVCLTGRQFHEIARPLLDGPDGRLIGPLMSAAIYGNETVLYKFDEHRSQLQWLPVAEVPPPRNVVGFQLIDLRYFDAQVYSFLGSVRQLLDGIHLGIGISTGFNGWDRDESRSSGYWPDESTDPSLAVLELLQLHVFPHPERAISTLEISSRSGVVISAVRLAHLLRGVRNFLLDYALPPPKTLSLAASPSFCSPYIPVLVEWLHTPTEDGQRKMASLKIFANLDDLTELIVRARQCIGQVLTLRLYTVHDRDQKCKRQYLALCRRRPNVERVSTCAERTGEDKTSDVEEWLAEGHDQLFQLANGHNKLALNVAQISQDAQSLFAFKAKEEEGAANYSDNEQNPNGGGDEANQIEQQGIDDDDHPSFDLFCEN